MQEPTKFTVDAAKCHIKVVGEVDVLTAPLLFDAVLQSQMTDLDLSEVSFMDSTGLNALIELRVARPSLRIVAASPPVQRLVQMTGLVGHLHVEINA